jgi:hypothetical protein
MGCDDSGTLIFFSHLGQGSVTNFPGSFFNPLPMSFGPGTGIHLHHTAGHFFFSTKVADESGIQMGSQAPESMLHMADGEKGACLFPPTD